MQNTFHDSSITDVITASDKSFSSFIPKLNQISNDIKAVEKYLKNKDLCIEFELKVHEYFIDDNDVNPNLDTSFQYLKWGKYKDQEYRLLLRETEESENFDYIAKDSVRPLIECPLHDRANAHKYLSKFIEKFSLEIDSIFDGYLSIEDEVN